MSELERAPGLVLAGILPAQGARMQAAAWLPPEAFEGKDASIWKAMLAYYRKYRAVLPTQTLADRLKTAPAETRAQIGSRWANLLELEVPDDQFQWAVTATFEAWREAEASRAIATAGEALLGGAQVTDRYGNATVIRGYEAMRQHLQSAWARLDAVGGGNEPESDLRDELPDILSDYGSASLESSVVIPSGVAILDAALAGGFRPGELALVAGYAGEGKTTFAACVLAYAAILRGYNVLYATGETLRGTVRRRIVVRHTRHPNFGLPTGVDINALRTGSLEAAHLDVYQRAARDLTENEAYGHLVIFQMPLRASFDAIMDRVHRYEAQWPVHMLIVDSIDMVRYLAPSNDRRGMVRAGAYREQISEAIEDFASLAVSHANGRGLCVVSPYQIKRAAYEDATTNEGRYELSALSETALAERRAAVVLSLLAMPDSPGQLRAQILKNREGPKAEFMLEYNHAHAYIGAAAGGFAGQRGGAAASLMGV